MECLQRIFFNDLSLKQMTVWVLWSCNSHHLFMHDQCWPEMSVGEMSRILPSQHLSLAKWALPSTAWKSNLWQHIWFGKGFFPALVCAFQQLGRKWCTSWSNTFSGNFCWWGKKTLDFSVALWHWCSRTRDSAFLYSTPLSFYFSYITLTSTHPESHRLEDALYRDEVCATPYTSHW